MSAEFRKTEKVASTNYVSMARVLFNNSDTCLRVEDWIHPPDDSHSNCLYLENESAVEFLLDVLENSTNSIEALPGNWQIFSESGSQLTVQIIKLSQTNADAAMRYQLLLNKAVFYGSRRDEASGEIISKELNGINELKADNSRLERMALLGELAGSLSHDIRNPLGVISSSLFYIRSTLDGAYPRLDAHFERAESNIYRCSAIIDEFLSNTAQRELNRQHCRPRDIVQDAVTSIETSREIELSISVEPENGQMFVDRDLCTLMLINLFRNSVEATTGPTRLKITFALVENCWRITVADNGPGFIEENAESVFRPLFTTKEFGTGFGLSMVKRTVVRHGGTVSIANADDGGAVISITIPDTVVGALS